MVALSVRKLERAEETRIPLTDGHEVLVDGGSMKFILKGWYDLTSPARRLLNVRVEVPEANGWSFHHTALVDVGNWSHAKSIPIRYLEFVVRKRLAEMD